MTGCILLRIPCYCDRQRSIPWRSLVHDKNRPVIRFSPLNLSMSWFKSRLLLLTIQMRGGAGHLNAIRLKRLYGQCGGPHGCQAESPSGGDSTGIAAICLHWKDCLCRDALCGARRSLSRRLKRTYGKRFTKELIVRSEGSYRFVHDCIQEVAHFPHCGRGPC